MDRTGTWVTHISQDMGNTPLRKEGVARALESSLLSHVASA